MSDLKYIFLDVDGVLNNTNNLVKLHNKLGDNEYLKLVKSQHTPFDKKSLKYLGKLIDKFKGNVRVIITSSWRLNNDKLFLLRNIIEKYSKYHIYIQFDKTIYSKDGIRGLEIDKYMSENIINRAFDDYVIIDDDDYDIIDRLDLAIPRIFSFHFVKCNCIDGFKRKEYKRALKILRGKTNESYHRIVQFNEGYKE